jgi:hypothetical protein
MTYHCFPSQLAESRIRVEAGKFVTEVNCVSEVLVLKKISFVSLALKKLILW